MVESEKFIRQADSRNLGTVKPDRNGQAAQFPVDLTVDRVHSRTIMVDEITFANVPFFGDRTCRPLKLNLMLPQPRQGETLPVLIFLCGGAWLAMDKDLWIPELVSFTRRGFAVACAEYRTSGVARFPAQIEDVKSAIRYLRAHAADWSLDPARFAIMGESAGGHLAVLAGATGETREFDTGDWLEQDSAVQAVVDYYGPTDFSQMSAWPTDSNHDAPDSPESRLIGGPIQKYPMPVQRANPITYLTREAPPTLILHGSVDRTVPCHQSQLLFDALQALGVPVEYYRLVGEGHATDAFIQPAVKDLVAEFLIHYLARQG